MQLLSEFLGSYPKATRKGYLRKFRLFASFQGARKKSWEKALYGYFRLSEREARQVRESYAEWCRRKYPGQRWAAYAVGLPTFASFLHQRGFISWKIPHPGHERSRRFRENCPAALKRHILGFLRPLQDVGLDRRWLATQEYGLVDFGRHLRERGGSIGSLTPALAESWIAGLRRKGLGGRTISQKLGTLQRFSAWLEATGVLREDPLEKVRWRLSSVPIRQPLEEEEVRSLFRAARDPRDRAIAYLLYFSAGWTSELAALDVPDVAIRGCFVRFKSRGRAPSKIPITKAAATAVSRYLRWSAPLRKAGSGADAAALFLNERGRRMSGTSFARVTGALARRAGILRRITPKVLRHSFATHFLDRGADLRTLQDFLGHANALSGAPYSQTAVGYLREVYDRTHPRA